MYWEISFCSSEVLVPRLYYQRDFLFYVHLQKLFIVIYPTPTVYFRSLTPCKPMSCAFVEKGQYMVLPLARIDKYRRI